MDALDIRMKDEIYSLFKTLRLRHKTVQLYFVIYDYYRSYNDDIDARQKTRDTMLFLSDNGYVESRDKSTFLTEKGLSAIEIGGILEYEENINKKERQSSYEQLRKKYLDYLGIGGGVIGIISGVFGALVYFGVVSKEEPNTKEIQTMQKQIELLTSKIESIEKTKPLEENKPTKEINNLQDKTSKVK